MRTLVQAASAEEAKPAGVPKACLVCSTPLTPSRLPGLCGCPACGFLTADMDLADHELAALYGPDYFHGGEYGDYQADRASHQHNFRLRLATLLRHVEMPRAKSLFEVGCAYGYFLEVARPHFGRVAGMDLSEEVVAAARGRGLDVRAGDFLAGDVGRHDVFCLWDTIEHLKHPDRFVARIADRIRPGGLLAITTGNAASLNARLRGRRWRMIHPPTHLHYFTRHSLTELLRRHGFTVVHAGHPGTSRSLRAVLHGALALKLNRAGLYRAIEPLVPATWSVSLNLFDILYLIARKQP